MRDALVGVLLECRALLVPSEGVSAVVGIAESRYDIRLVMPMLKELSVRQPHGQTCHSPDLALHEAAVVLEATCAPVGIAQYEQEVVVDPPPPPPENHGFKSGKLDNVFLDLDDPAIIFARKHPGFTPFAGQPFSWNAFAKEFVPQREEQCYTCGMIQSISSHCEWCDGIGLTMGLEATSMKGTLPGNFVDTNDSNIDRGVTAVERFSWLAFGNGIVKVTGQCGAIGRCGGRKTYCLRLKKFCIGCSLWMRVLLVVCLTLGECYFCTPAAIRDMASAVLDLYLILWTLCKKQLADKYYGGIRWAFKVCCAGPQNAFQVLTFWTKLLIDRCYEGMGGAFVVCCAWPGNAFQKTSSFGKWALDTCRNQSPLSDIELRNNRCVVLPGTKTVTAKMRRQTFTQP
jgi:hypothetical protein